jgi:hypothetical protein
MKLRLRVIKEDEAEVRGVEDKPCILLAHPGSRELDRYAVLEVQDSWQHDWEEVELKLVEGN